MRARGGFLGTVSERYYKLPFQITWLIVSNKIEFFIFCNSLTFSVFVLFHFFQTDGKFTVLSLSAESGSCIVQNLVGT